jgi:hypothetical protein
VEFHNAGMAMSQRDQALIADWGAGSRRARSLRAFSAG